MPKFKVEVNRVYSVTHVVEADDLDHAREIGSEITDEMEVNNSTFMESDWNARQVDDNEKATYEPIQEYLK
jgi:hypothetical protein